MLSALRIQHQEYLQTSSPQLTENEIADRPMCSLLAVDQIRLACSLVSGIRQPGRFLVRNTRTECYHLSQSSFGVPFPNRILTWRRKRYFIFSSPLAAP